MNKDQVREVLEGNIIDDPVISIWRHYPEHDLDIDSLIEVHLNDYKQYPSDLVKLSPQGRFPAVDFGCEIVPGTTEHGSSGSSSCKKCAIQTLEDWRSLEKIDPLDGHLGDTLTYIETMSRELENKPIMMTIFSPTMVARKISDNLFENHIADPSTKKIAEQGLNIIHDVFIEYGNACLDAGADGLFIAVQEADLDKMPSKDLISTMIDYNVPYFDYFNNKADFTVLHLHGTNVDFEQSTTKLQPTAVNWHDKISSPSLTESRELFKGGLLGGIDPTRALHDDIEDDIAIAVQLKQSLPLILAPGCVLLQGTKSSTLDKIFSLYK